MTKLIGGKWAVKWVWGLGVAIALGVLFRLIWVEDIEYKADEAYSFARTKEFIEHAQFVSLGMPASKGFLNPGLSVWVFYGIGYITGVEAPTNLARGVQCWNIVALLLMLGFALRCFKGREREWWLWALALVCVNPFSVLLQRKIWPPSVFPAFMVCLIICWLYRQRRWGAFGWGIIAILSGQIHMSGWFYAAAFFLWTVISDRRRVAWLWWTGGTLVGMIPLLPWLHYLAHTSERPSAGAFGWWRLFEAKFWVTWITEPFGIGLQYSLDDQFPDFLKWPLWHGSATFGMAILHGLSCGLLLWLLMTNLVRWLRAPTEALERCRREHSIFTVSLLQAGFWTYGIIMTVACLHFERHYLAITFPLTMIWAARLALPFDATDRGRASGRLILLSLCAINAMLTFTFLDYIHIHSGTPHNGYERSYKAQVRSTAPS